MDSDKKEMPKHVGIIMDGNGRWAKKRNLPRTYGHKEGVKRVLDIVRAGYKMGIPYLSLFAFSTENWKRPQKEIDNLMFLLRTFLVEHVGELEENGVRLNVMGDLSALNEKTSRLVYEALNRTSKGDKMILNIGLNYGGQDEIVLAAKKIAEAVKEGSVGVEEIDSSLFESYLYTKGQPPLDLLIRPSGELRVSNFMLYQMAYSEFWFSNVLWPDFTESEFKKAIDDYQRRDRRFGGL
ncbi:MAG: isoprenyl transferase [Peptoniphilus sp.]|nr:isoprenyl transferase [Peptoniphilus sp.]MDD7362968.1 isoprenyl transferase [Bacillota bacterium]MDY6044208.1 isoprenyl transferase [Peptoniphilus sp.]